MANPESIPLTNLGCTHDDGGALRNSGHCFTLLTPAATQQESGNELWDMYLDEVKEDDKRISDAWKEDSNGILVFTGLFSATVGAFILEFYKKLSPDSGDQTVALLGQISQQLANFPNGTYSNTATQPSPPSASLIWVNSMWLISLLLSLTSALIATLLQQWARRYVEIPKVPNEPNHRARVRSFLFLGTESYKMRRAVQIAPTLLHLSVYLFFGGLVIVFHTINKKVAIAVDVAVGLFGLAYIALSFLPCLDVQCPYRTPMSYILWYPCHAFPFVAALCLRWFLRRLHGHLVPPSLDNHMPDWQRIVNWLESCGNAVNTHWQYIMDGLGESIINDAKKVQGDMDSKIVTWLFSRLVLGDRNKLQKFAASIPRDKVLSFLPPVESLREPLRILLRSCAVGTRLVGPNEDVRKRSLLVCLDAIINYIAKAPDNPDFDFMRTEFADTRLMEALWNDSDTAIRITSCSLCALLARQVMRKTLTVPRLRWLRDVTREESDAIYAADFVTRDHMNLRSFMDRVLSNQVVGDLPTEDAMSFKETLAILLDIDDADFDTNYSQDLLSEEVRWIQQVDPQDSHEVVAKLHSIFPFLSTAPRPP